MRKCKRPNCITDIRGGPFNTGRGGMVFLSNQIIFFLPSRKQNFFFLLEQKTNNLFPEMSQKNFFFHDMFEDPFNCKTGMRGTVTCRPTVAIEYTLTAFMSAAKLINTRYYSNETLTQCCFNARPVSATLAQCQRWASGRHIATCGDRSNISVGPMIFRDRGKRTEFAEYTL